MSDDAKSAFRALFTGSDGCYGINMYGKGAIKTQKGPAGDIEWAQHYEGQSALGQVPIRQDDTCIFAAIDLDFYSIDGEKDKATDEEVASLMTKLEKIKIPVHVCKSRHGSIHLYTFIREPGQSARAVRKVLSSWALALGFSEKQQRLVGKRFVIPEIFPKQDALIDDALGSWIFLPYFGHQRLCIEVQGSNIVELTLIEFLHKVDPVTRITAIENNSKNPPCLDALEKEVFTANSGRNGYLFNYGVLLKKKGVEDWEQQLRKRNFEACDPHISEPDIKDIIKSLKKKEYNYTCGQMPIVGVCDMHTCASREFGVNSQSLGDFDPFNPTSLVKVLTNPPEWRIEVNNSMIPLTTEELMKFIKLREKILSHTSMLVPKINQKVWEPQLKALLQLVKNVPAPETASEEGMILAAFFDIMKRHPANEDEPDAFLTGRTYLRQGTIYFDGARLFQQIKLRSGGLQYLQIQKLFSVLQRKVDCHEAKLAIKGERHPAWAVSERHFDFSSREYDDTVKPLEDTSPL